MPIRVATFNAHNLFTRAKVFNLATDAEVAAVLDKVRDLQRLLVKTTYAPADKTGIENLLEELRPYVEVREDRGSLYTGSGSDIQVTASGSKAWDGEIEFKRAAFSELTRRNTARVFNAVKADVFCVVEAESRPVLGDFDTALLNPRFPYHMLIDGNDERGIDVGLYSRFPLGRIRTHVFDGTPASRTFSRDCPEYEVLLPSGRSLHVLPNHFKSKGYGSQASSNARRRRQAEAVRAILGGYDLSTDLVVVAGDLNDTPESNPLEPLRTLPDLHDVLAVQFPTSPGQRWTYKFGNQLNQIDYLYVSTALRNKLTSAGVERRGIFGAPGVTPFPDITGPANAASDHGAVFADFDVA